MVCPWSRTRVNRCIPAGLALVCIVALGGCASFRPQPRENNTFWERVETQRDGPVSVSVGVLNPEESLQAFGVKMYKHGVDDLDAAPG